MKMTFIFIAALVGMVGCSSSDGGSTTSEITEEQARTKAGAAAPGGTVGQATKLDEGEEHRWSVSVTLPNGAGLAVEIERATGSLMEIKGENGPFDYDLPAPQAGYMTFSQAKQKALTLKTGNVELWEVKTDIAIYELYVREASTQLYEIKLDAKTGEMKSVEQKAKAD